MTKQQEYKIGHVCGIGRTKTAARESAERLCAQALDGSWTPELVRGTRYTALVVRSDMGWESRRVDDSGISVGSTQYGYDRSEAVRASRRHVASFETDEREARRILRDDAEALKDWREYRAWQSRFAALRAEGKSADEAHALAGCVA